MDPRHEQFCQHYLACFNAAEAARRAGYSEAAATNTGYKLLRRPDIQQFLNEARARDAIAADVSRARLMDELKKIAFADLRDAMTWGVTEIPAGGGAKLKLAVAEPKDSASLDPNVAAAISEISAGKQGFKIKLHDKLGAIDKLARMIGAYEADNSQVADALASLITAAQGTALPVGVPVSPISEDQSA